MAERSLWSRAGSGLAVGVGVALVPLGCGFVPKTRLDDATKLVQGLRAENAQLKDTNLGLKVQNQDLTQRAVDDSQAIQGLETATTQFERSIQAYQEDRERMRSAFNELKDQVRSSGNR